MVLFTREDWTLFRSLETLPQKAGVPIENLPRLVAKELVDNALDVAGYCTIDPLGEYGFTVGDEGGGIAGGSEAVAAIFSIARPLLTSKLLRLPTRGALGNGLRVVTGAVLASGGSLIVSTNGQVIRLYPQDDGQTRAEVTGMYEGAGTRVDVYLGPSLPMGESRLDWARRAILLAQGDTYRGKTSPHWYTSDAFFSLTQAAGDRPVRDLLAEFDGLTRAALDDVSASFANRMAAALSREDADTILSAMRQLARPVNGKRLGKVGLIHELPPSYTVKTGQFEVKAVRGSLDATIPFVIEVWASIADHPEIQVSVNKTPITAEVEVFHKKNELTLFGCGLRHKFPVGKNPVSLWLNIQTPYMPITTDGKAPNLEPLVGPIAEAAQRAATKAKRGWTRAWGKARTQKDVILENLDDAISEVSKDGRYRYSQRQLFYAIRPFILGEIGKEPDYDYFTQVLTAYESQYGDIAGLYRDPRGTVYHPHTGEEIPLGTLSVEDYQRPEWAFNKVLYLEKEGFFSILKSEKWPERHDCALLTSKGQASRAAKDLLDLLGETGEDLMFFCIHDADAAGTLIYQALQEGTRARPGRRVQIINLGLEPWEAIDLNLQVETAKYEKRQPAAEYVPADWVEWLQTHRVELNAMPTEFFIDWLDSKFAGYEGKVIPPQDVMVDRLVEEIRDGLNERLASQILEEAELNRQVEDAYRRIEHQIDQRTRTLRPTISRQLSSEPLGSWREVLARLAAEIVDRE